MFSRIVGMERSYVDETFTKFYNPTEIAQGAQDVIQDTRTGLPDIIESLYRLIFFYHVFLFFFFFFTK